MSNIKTIRKEWKPNGMSSDDYFRLLSQYYEELKHRDTMFWKQIYIYFYGILIFSILPILKPNGLELSEKIPRLLFPVFGIGMSIGFLYVALAYSARLKAISQSYRDLLKAGPPKYPNYSLEEIKASKKYRGQMAATISKIMFLLMVGLNIMIFILLVLGIV